MRIHIKALKYIILSVMLVLLGILLLYTQPQTDLIPFASKSNDNKIKLEDKEAIENLKNASNTEKANQALDQSVTRDPNFIGEDDNNKLWTLKATKAVQTGGLSTGVTSLFDVIAQTFSQNDSKIDYFADSGDYIPSENKVVLKGNVRLKS